MAVDDGPPVDREAVFVAMFDAYYPKIVAYVWGRLGPDAADEAVADTFITAWSNFDKVPDEPLIWLYGIARGAIANHRRRLQRRARLHDRVRALSSERTRSDPAEVAVWRSSFATAVAHLSELDKEALRLALWEGLPAAEAAAVLGCSTTAYKVRLHRARQRLRRFLRDDGPTDRRALHRGDTESAAPAAKPMAPLEPTVPDHKEDSCK
jgi:RNA polymerase sigma-70 factor (ECF subfamily)